MDTTATVLERHQLTGVTVLFRLSAPLVARNAAPGQFVILRVRETGERVPISLTDFDAAAGTITIVVQEVGKTTAMICALEEGDSVLDLAGPLGTPVELPASGRVVLVAGGFGTGAVHPLARELQARSVPVDAILGARTASLLILRDLLEGVCDTVHLCTDDGSLGYHGVVTGLLDDLLVQGAGYTACYAVGPMPMMRAVADTTARWDLPAMVSLDPVMIDGTGMCGGCRVTVGGVSRFACVDGPFFDAHAVDFDEAIARKAMYAREEHEACELAASTVRV